MVSPPSEDFVASLYRQMRLIRRVEEEIIRVYPTDKVKSPVHLSIGQESVAVGVCANLNKDDVLYATYRGHAAYLAKGGDLGKMFMELYGKSGGLASGKAGSMHLGDMDVNMVGTSAIVATSIPLAVGNALAMRMQNRDAVTVVFFGEGATDEGVFHESLNFAALKKLPILFVCENNSYAIYSHVRDRMPDDNICERAEAYRVPATLVEGGDVFAIHDAAREKIEAIRNGTGPQFLECMTYRWRDHVGPGEDRYIQYRPDSELDSWIQDDQVSRVAGMLAEGVREKIDTEIENMIAAAENAADESAFPDAETMYTNVYQ